MTGRDLNRQYKNVMKEIINSFFVKKNEINSNNNNLDQEVKLCKFLPTVKV